MTVVARRVASVPRRTSVETWQRIVELVSEPGSEARSELERVTSVAASLIADEYTRTTPITISGGGPLVRVYTLHDNDATESDLSDEDELAFDPTASDAWLLSLPAAGPDVGASESLLADAAHVAVLDISPAGEVEQSTAPATKAANPGLVLNLEELARP